jgi:antitoxin HicB
MRYPARFEREDNGVFTVYIPGVGGGPNPEIATCGDTLEEARHNAQEALEGVLLSMMDHRQLPEAPAAHLESTEDWEWVHVSPTIAIAMELRRERAARSFTQAQVAKELGISQQSYAELENPEREGYSIGTLERVAKVFGKRLEVGFTAA